MEITMPHDWGPNIAFFIGAILALTFLVVAGATGTWIALPGWILFPLCIGFLLRKKYKEADDP